MRIIDRRFLLVAAVVVIAGCASASGGVQPASVKPAAKTDDAITPPAMVVRRFTRIIVKADCSATIDDKTIFGKRNKKIGWLVEDEGCTPDEGSGWHIELVFDVPDWNRGGNRTVKIDADDFKSIKIHPQADVTPPGMRRYYKVVLVKTNFFGFEVDRDDLIDPEVDIQM